MDRKQKEQLRFLLKARRRADKVLAQRRDAEREKLERQTRQEADQARMKQAAEALTSLAQECGILALVEQAALARGGSLKKEVHYYTDYGFNSSHLHRAVMEPNLGELRVAYLALRITWDAGGTGSSAGTSCSTGSPCEAEVRVRRRGQITFHNNILPVFAFIWRRYPALLGRMLTSALAHPGHPAPPEQPGGRDIP
jgi:hypothetical protein